MSLQTSQCIIQEALEDYFRVSTPGSVYTIRCRTFISVNNEILIKIPSRTLLYVID